jgi:acetyl-CoA carboxylase biotin carboxyl carrier protein
VSLSARDVAEILRLLEDSTFDELSLEMGDIKVNLRRSGACSSPRPAAQTSLPERAVAPPIVEAPRSTTEFPDAAVVAAPLLGIFYRAPKPGDAPFVEVGAKVEADTIIGIIEVMKLMNTVRAGVRGQVVEISAGNGELVEYGEALLRVRPA